MPSFTAIDVPKLSLTEPKRNARRGHGLFVNREAGGYSPVVFDTPALTAPFGVSQYDSASKKTLSLRVPKGDELAAFLQSLDAKLVAHVAKHSVYFEYRV